VIHPRIESLSALTQALTQARHVTNVTYGNWMENRIR